MNSILVKYETYLNKANGGRIITQATPLLTGSCMGNIKDCEEITDMPYREVIGSLAYLMIRTRPDITFAVSALSRYLVKPTHRHRQTAMHVLNYLRGTQDIGVTYKTGERVDNFPEELLNVETASEPTGAVDSDFGNDTDESKSTTGYLIMMNGGAISWKSKRQSMVATSTCHAEYIAASELAREIVWLRMLLNEIGFKLKYPSVVLEDNAAALQMVFTKSTIERNNHIRVRRHYVRECMEFGGCLNKRDGARSDSTPATGS